MSPAGAVSFLLVTHMFVIQLHSVIPATPWEAEWKKVQDDALLTLKSKLSITALKADADSLAKFEAFKLDKDISFSSFKDPKNLQMANTWFTFSTRLTLNIQRGSKFSALNGCSYERTKQTYDASGNLQIDPASNELVYEKITGGVSGETALARTIAKIGWPERKSDEYVNCDKDDVQSYAESILVATFDRIVANAFLEALRKLQWKDGHTPVNGLNENVMKDLITKNLGTEPFAFELKRAQSWLTEYDCAWKHDVAFDKVKVSPADIAKQGSAILVTVEFSKVKFACVSKNGDRSRGIDIPLLKLRVRLEPDASKSETKPFALKCVQIDDDRQTESPAKGNTRLDRITKTLKDKYTYDLCAFVVEMGGTSWSNFPALRDQYNRYYSRSLK